MTAGPPRAPSPPHRAPRVLVHGATGFTGGLVCEALARRGVPFAASGRSASKLERVLGAAERVVVDLRAPETLVAALRGRAVVSACAGPFVDVGEPVVATAARLGVSYVDICGEHAFVSLVMSRYRATAEASGAVLAPAMAFEVAPADWCAAACAAALDGPPDEVLIAYATRGRDGGVATSAGTRRSALGVVAAGLGTQWVDGAARAQPIAADGRRVDFGGGMALACASFPSPESVLVPLHTAARTVRTFMALPRAISPRVARVAGRALPALSVVLRGRRVARWLTRGGDAPDPRERRASEVRVACEARRGGRQARVVLRGADPYGVTAEIQALAIERALAEPARAGGLLAPSARIPVDQGFALLRALGWEVTES